MSQYNLSHFWCKWLTISDDRPLVFLTALAIILVELKQPCEYRWKKLILDIFQHLNLSGYVPTWRLLRSKSTLKVLCFLLLQCSKMTSCRMQEVNIAMKLFVELLTSYKFVQFWFTLLRGDVGQDTKITVFEI